METITVNTEAVEKENKEVALIIQEVQQIVINNNEQYQSGADYLKKIKSKSLELDTLRKSLTKPLDLSKRKIMELFKPPIELLQKAERLIKIGMVDWTQKQERIRREREDKLARQAAAEEKRKREALEARAQKAAEKGNEEKAEALREQAEEVKVEAPVLAQTVEQPKGVSYKEKYTAEVVDFAKLPDEYKLPNLPMLNKVAQATKGQILIAGVEFKSEKIVASRSF